MDLTLEERLTYGKFFENKIYESDGQNFEKLFSLIMHKLNSNFRNVKPYGRMGDMKNDGFDSSSGTYYQVYGPEDLQKSETVQSAKNKLRKDLDGLINNWDDVCQVRVFYFVVNDKFKSVPSPLMYALEDIRHSNKYPQLKRIGFLTSCDLKEIFLNFDKSSMVDILEFVPVIDSTTLEFGALDEAVKYIVNIEIESYQCDRLSLPDFDEKINFNKLGDKIRSTLIYNLYQIHELEKYFKANPHVNRALQEKFNSLYKKSCDVIPLPADGSADARYYYILKMACPDNRNAVQNAVQVLMAHYFSCCDIFEEPINCEDK